MIEARQNHGVIQMDSSFNRLLADASGLQRMFQPVMDAKNLRRLAGLDTLDELRRHVGLNDNIQGIAAQYSAKALASDVLAQHSAKTLARDAMAEYSAKALATDFLAQHTAKDALTAFRQWEASQVKEMKRIVEDIFSSSSALNVAQKMAADLAGTLSKHQDSAAVVMEAINAKARRDALAFANGPLDQAMAAARAALMPLSLPQYRSLVDALADAARESEFEVDQGDVEALGADPALQAQAAQAVAGIAAGLQGEEKTVAKMTGPEFRALLKQAYGDNKESLLSKLAWLFAMALLVNVLNSVFSFFLQYYGTKLLDAQSSQEATKQVKQAGRDAVADRDVLKELRFVSAKTLTVRTKAGARAPAVGQLQFGRMVHLLDKDGDFSLIAWHSEEDQGQIQGWVFSRYLKRFD